MADYTSQLATASRLIREKGLPVTHRRVEFSGAYNPATDSYDQTETLTEVYAVRTTAGDAEQRNYGFAIGSAVLYVAADVLDSVLVTDSFVVQGVEWAIQKVSTTQPAEAPLLFAVELKAQGTSDD